MTTDIARTSITKEEIRSALPSENSTAPVWIDSVLMYLIE